jgi:hypothetical protein
MGYEARRMADLIGFCFRAGRFSDRTSAQSAIALMNASRTSP